jgi:hypothetical protein
MRGPDIVLVLVLEMRGRAWIRNQPPIETGNIVDFD